MEREENFPQNGKTSNWSVLETAQATNFLHDCFSGTPPTIGRPSHRHEHSKRLLKSPCSWAPELGHYHSPPSHHLQQVILFNPFPHRSAFMQLQGNLYYASLWASNFCRAHGICSYLRKQVGAPKPSLVEPMSGSARAWEWGFRQEVYKKGNKQELREWAALWDCL